MLVFTSLGSLGVSMISLFKKNFSNEQLEQTRTFDYVKIKKINNRFARDQENAEAG